MEIAKYMAGTTDDIKYDELDAETLEELIRADEDQFIATDALHMLNIKEPALSFEVSKDIFQGKIGDKYLKCQALAIIYGEDRHLIFADLKGSLDGYEQIVLEQLVELCWLDLNEYKADANLRNYLSPLISKIKGASLDDFENKEYVRDLLTLEV